MIIRERLGPHFTIPVALTQCDANVYQREWRKPAGRFVQEELEVKGQFDGVAGDFAIGTTLTGLRLANYFATLATCGQTIEWGISEWLDWPMV